MKRKCKELKQISRGNLIGFYGIFILAMILISMIPSFVFMPFNSALQKGILLKTLKPSTIITYFVASLLIALISAILGAGLFKLHLNRARNLPLQIGDIFSQFKKRPDRFMVGTLIIILIQLALCVPLFIGLMLVLPNIIQQGLLFQSILLMPILFILILYIITMVISIYLSLRFSQFMIILVDHEDYSAIDSLKASWKLMGGNVGRLLYLSLSFIGLFILGAFSFGIAFLWIEPYRTQTNVQFYLDITGQIDQRLADEKRMDEEMGPVMEY